MSIQAHLTTLKIRHQALEQEIDGKQAHYLCDHLKITELKRRKLHIKDEIVYLQQGVSALAPGTKLSAKERTRASIRKAKLKPSRWYADARRSISIKGEPL
jgi:hypothetical protein